MRADDHAAVAAEVDGLSGLILDPCDGTAKERIGAVHSSATKTRCSEVTITGSSYAGSEAVRSPRVPHSLDERVARCKAWLKRQHVNRPMLGLLWEPDIPPLPVFVGQIGAGGELCPDCIQPVGSFPK